MPETIEYVFFRADSEFFSGELFNWDYLVKVKLKNLKKILQSKIWLPIKEMKDIAICKFTYKSHGWSKPRVLMFIRSVKDYVQEYLSKKQVIPIYQYVCHTSNLNLDAIQLHELYKQHSTNKIWIEQVKGQAMISATLTDYFWTNDILWQISIIAKTDSPDGGCAKRKINSSGRNTEYLLTGLLQYLKK